MSIYDELIKEGIEKGVEKGVEKTILKAFDKGYKLVDLMIISELGEDKIKLILTRHKSNY